MGTENLAPVDRAHTVDQSIREGCHATRTALVMLGGLLHEGLSEKYWKLLGYDSERAWLASPGLELSYSHAKGIAQVWRELVEERGVDPDQLGGIDVRKAQAILPAVRDEKVSVDEALSDCRTLGRLDLKTKYESDDPGGGGSEPDYEVCESCGQVVRGG